MSDENLEILDCNDHEACDAYAARLWLSASFGDETVASHPFARQKGIENAGGARRGRASGEIIGTDADCLIVPIYTGGVGKLQGVQCINEKGEKQIFGKIEGGCLLIGNTFDLKKPWYVAEGWASSYSVVFHHRKSICAVAFDEDNQNRIMHLLADKFQPENVISLIVQKA